MDIKIEIPGNPGDARINGAKRATIVKTPKGPKPATRPTDPFKRWRKAARLFVRAAWREAGQRAPLEGAVTLEVRAYWPRLRRTGPAEGHPLGDVDAVAKAVLDVLQDAGVLGDDGQVRELVLVSEYDRKRPRIEVRLGMLCELSQLRESNEQMCVVIERLEATISELEQRDEARDSEAR